MTIQDNHSRDFDFWHKKGSELDKQKKYSDALAAYRNAAELNPKNSAIWSSIALILGHLDRRLDALEAYDNAITLDPKSAPAMHNKAFYFDWFGVNDEDTEQAISLYKKALELDPKLYASWHQLAFLFFDIDKYDEALDAFTYVIENFDENDNYQLDWLWDMKAKSLTNLHRDNEALEAFNKAISLNKDVFDEESFYNIGCIFMRNDNFEDAKRIYSQGVNEFPEEYAFWYNLGYAYYELSRYDEACLAADEAIALYTNDSKHWYLRGFCLKELGRIDEALAAFQQAEKCDGDNEDGRYPRYLEFHEDYCYWWNLKGTLFAKLHRQEEALLAFDKAIAKNPHQADYWDNKGLALAELGRKEESAQAYKRADEIRRMVSAEIITDHPYQEVTR